MDHNGLPNDGKSPGDQSQTVHDHPRSDSLSRHDTSSTVQPYFGKDVELHRTKSIAEQMSRWREFLFVGIICSAQITTQMALINTIIILHIIGKDLNITNPGVLSWLIAGYSLTVGSFILISGRFGDMFGYKRMILFGFGWFGVWNLVAGLAVYSNAVLFVFARVLSGIGPAILLPNALGLLGATYAPGKSKNMVFSLFGGCAPVGAVIGGLSAGLWSLLWWPWTFWTFAIAMFIMVILSIIILPSVPLKPELQELTVRQKIVQLDLLGATVGVTAMILFNFAWNQAPGFGWENVYIYVLLIIGLLLFILFFWIEMKVATNPLVPFDIFTGDVCFVLASIALGWASFGIWIYYIYQFLEVLQGASPLLSIAKTCPIAISGMAAAITTGKIIHRIGPAWVMFCSMCAFLTGTLLVATAPIEQSYWAQIFVCSIIIPWGMDMSFPAGTLILSNSVAKERQGVGASLVNTVVNYSISVGVGIAGTVDIQTSRGGKTPEDILRGYRGALYLAVSLAATGMAVALAFVLKVTVQKKKEKSREEKGHGGEEGC